MACGWDVSYADCVAEGSRDQKFLDQVPSATRDLAEEMATDYLSRWTGRVFGPCEVTVRPCRVPGRIHGERVFTSHVSTPSGGTWSPVLLDGSWYNIGCGSCGMSCSCRGPSVISLPRPVGEILSIEIEGVELDPDAYRVDNSRWLVRQDGLPWPTWQNRDAPDGSPGTWSVTYMRGREVPAGGRIAAGVFSLQIMKALCHDNTCELPQRVQTITRQGVTMTMMDGFEDLEAGRTGLWLVDSWVASIMSPPRGGRVLSPDVVRQR